LTEDRRERRVERKLARLVWRRELAAAGGPQWSAEDLAEDLAWAAFFWVSVSHVPYMETVQFGEEFRFHRRFKALEGTIAGAERWGAAERMKAHM